MCVIYKYIFTQSVILMPTGVIKIPHLIVQPACKLRCRHTMTSHATSWCSCMAASGGSCGSDPSSGYLPVRSKFALMAAALMCRLIFGRDEDEPLANKALGPPLLDIVLEPGGTNALDSPQREGEREREKKREIDREKER